MPEESLQAESMIDPQTIEGLAVIAAELEKLVQQNGVRRETFRVSMLYRRAAELPVTDAAALGMFLHDYLLHDCLYLTEFEDREIRMDRYSLREILSKWLDSLTDSVLWKIRPRLLTTTLEFVERKPSPDALFVVTGIGYRNKETVHTLKRIAERNDITGDTALRLLVGIRVQGEDLEWVRNRFDERFRSGNPTFELLFGMSILGGDGVIERFLEIGTAGGQNWDIFHRLGLLCDLAPGDRDYQDRIWGAIETLANIRDNGWRELLFCGGVLEKCQTPKVVESLVSHLSQIVRDGAVHFLGNRFEAFNSPIHANAAKQLRPTADVAELKPIAVRQSDSQDRMMTAQNYEQNYAWEISLFLGSSAVFDWIPPAVDHETNTLMQHRLMERMAVLSCSKLPQRAMSLLTDPALDFKRGSNEPEILPFLASCRLAASSASFESLDMLLGAAGLIDGFPFRSPLEDGADLAVWLHAQQVKSIIDRLVRAADAEGLMGKGIALRALRQIARKDNNVVSMLEALASTMAGPGTKPFLRVESVIALVSRTSPPPTTVVERIVQLCEDKEEQVRTTAVSAILELGLFTKFREIVVASAYGVLVPGSLRAGELPKELTDHQALLIGKMAALDADAFAGDAAAIVQDAFTLASSEALRGIRVGLRVGGQVPSVVVDALIARIRTGQSLSMASMYLFVELKRLSPERLLAERWEEVWENWMPDSRQALADCLQSALSITEMTERARAVDLLKPLLVDAAFAVRRSAARAMAAMDNSMLGKLCQEWIDSGSILLKHHAAEAAAWLPPDDLRTLDNHFIRGLQADPERRVREAVERSRKELRRRLWVDEHLAAVQAGDANDPNGWVLGNYGHGAALGRIGDDDTERQMREAAQRQDIPPNVRHWFETIAENIERQWRDTTRKWPESWLPWKGSVDQVEGQIGIGDTLYAAQLTLWLSPREDDLSLPPWGGAATLRDANPFFVLQLLQSVGDSKGSILIAGRNRAEVLIVDADGSQVIFVGSAPYPKR